MGIMHKENGETVIDLKAIFRLVLRKLPVIIFVMIVGGLLALAYSLFLVTPQYQARVTLYVNNRTSQENTESVTASDLSASAQLVDTYAAIISSNTMLREVIQVAQADVSVDTLQSRLTIQAVNNTEVFSVKVMDPSPKTAAKLANAIAQLAPERISGIVEGSSVRAVDLADIPTQIATPNYKKNTAIGAFIGLVIVLVIIFVVAINDTGIKSEVDFEEWPYPMLSSVPDMMVTKQKKGYGYGKGK